MGGRTGYCITPRYQSVWFGVGRQHRGEMALKLPCFILLISVFVFLDTTETTPLESRYHSSNDNDVSRFGDEDLQNIPNFDDLSYSMLQMNVEKQRDDTEELADPRKKPSRAKMMKKKCGPICRLAIMLKKRIEEAKKRKEPKEPKKPKKTNCKWSRKCSKNSKKGFWRGRVQKSKRPKCSWTKVCP